MRFGLRKLTVMGVVAATALMVGAFGVRAQDKSVINLYSSGDTNITDWLQNSIIPAFEKEYPQYKVQFTNSRAAGDEPIVDRALAALQTNSDPQVEVMDVDPRDFQAAEKAGLWYKPTVEDIPNLKNVIKAAAELTDEAAAYRGSQVLIAYNSEAIKEDEVPKTFADLVKWIKEHPGKFVYCRPDKGGSGGNFVVRALYEVSGNDPKLWTPEFDQKLVDEYYPKLWDLLNSINPDIYDNGAYPAGNNPVIELFANGEVDMISAWSDQAIQGIAKGVLPETTKLLQFTDLPMPGGYTHLSIPKNAANLKGAQDFVNFMLSVEGQTSVVKEIGGFPAISWDSLPKDLQAQFSSVITDNVPRWPGGDYSAPLTKGWYENVATNIKQGS
jgi:putative spermidine/putrescine transport system substrate-binding protein